MKKKILVICLILVCSVMVFASGNQEGGEGKSDIKIALINKSYTNPFWEYMRLAAADLAAQEGFELIYLAPTKPYNLEEQTRLVDDVVARRVDGIVIVPVDSVGMVPAIERAVNAGIPVANANTKLQGGDVINFTAIENYDAMTLVSEYMMEKMGGKGKVVILEGTPGNQTAIDRLRAQQDVIAKYPDVEILASQTAKFDRAEGMMVMENLLQSYPQIDAVLTANVEMSLGAIEALRAAGRLENVLVGGFDITPDGVKAILDGEMTVTLDQQPDQQAVLPIKAILAKIRGEEVQSYNKVEGVIIDSSNIEDYLYILEKEE